MSKKEFLDMLIVYAKGYRKLGGMESVKRNRHMNQYEDEPVSPQTLDAILVDFINFIGVRQGLDLGLYTIDLDKEITMEEGYGR